MTNIERTQDDAIMQLLLAMQKDGGWMENLLEHDQEEGGAVELVENWQAAIESMIEALNDVKTEVGIALLFLLNKVNFLSVNLQIQRTSRNAAEKKEQV